jgi:hypothetical protein
VADDWDYTITPYVWLPSLDVSLDVGPNPPVSSEKSILDVLDGAFLINGEARKKRWSFLGEFNYLNLSDDFALGPSNIRAGWALQGTMISVGAGYAVLDDSRTRLEVVGGLRAWDLEATTRVANVRARQDVSFIDPMIGLRVETPLSDRVTLHGLANIGGDNFGSDQQIEAIAQVSIPFRDTMSMAAGYRYLQVDFSEDNVVSDTTMQGPFISFSFNF